MVRAGKLSVRLPGNAERMEVMGNTRERLGAASVAVAGGIFRIILYLCVVVLIFWAGKTTYQFGYDVFNQQAMSPGEGTEITVVIQEGTSVYRIGKILESKGLIKDARVFYVQEKLSNHKGDLKPGTYLLSTAYTPDRIMSILAGDEEEEEDSP